jgi:phosphoserine aminotransferase
MRYAPATMTRAKNFNAGPAALPEEALVRAQKELLDFEGTGMSVMEQSHRGKEYEKVHDEAIALVKKLLDVPADYEVLFLQGGASQQFAVIPMNFLTQGSSAAYVVTGVWGEKAVGEAQIVAKANGAEVVIAATTLADKTYVKVPAEAQIAVPAGAKYMHFTSNETIHGVEFATAPGAAFPQPTPHVPVICDMSSDFLWRKVDVSKFDMIYAGAQKNIGPSGVTVVVAKKSFLESGRKDLPKIFQYRTHAENKSLYNTPPTFGIYLVRNVLAWLDARGGLSAMEAENRAKANALYGAIDRNPGFYKCPVEKASRSVMNIVFRLPTEADEEAFVKRAKAAGMVGLKGHRSVGGIRVSLYNAVPLAWVEELAKLMDEFAGASGALK